MPADTRFILAQIDLVTRERALRGDDPALVAAVTALKQYQQRRFAMTYADLLESPRYGSASRFFLDELYGPRDFTERDTQFARVVPAMVRLFPQEIVDTIGALAELHGLSERFDTVMARHLKGAAVERVAYAQAWQRTGDPAGRERQILLTLEVGRSLDRLTRMPLLRRTLHLMRGPARAAGLPALQKFLETGFDTFKAMNGAEEFLATVGMRERALAQALFGFALESTPLHDVTRSLPFESALAQLP